MPKRIKQEDRKPKDVNELAYYRDASTQRDGGTLPPTRAQVSMLMAEMGRKGGKIGGKRRLETMTAKQRRAAATKAARARWGIKED